MPHIRWPVGSGASRPRMEDALGAVKAFTPNRSHSISSSSLLSPSSPTALRIAAAASSWAAMISRSAWAALSAAVSVRG
jgi:hypothetical protein